MQIKSMHYGHKHCSVYANADLFFSPHYAVNMDYVVINEVLVFPSGASPPFQRCFPIEAINDFSVEVIESYQISASSPDPEAEFSPGSNFARVDIIDNDRKFPYNIYELLA